MPSHTPKVPRSGRRRSLAVLTATAIAAAVGVLATGPTASAAAEITIHASPSGRGTACTSSAPCSITEAKAKVEAIDTAMTGDIVVQLAGGTYRLSAPLTLTGADSGTDGHTVSWQAAPGATPVFSGGAQVTGWTEVNPAQNIWEATLPAGVSTRDLWVDGTRATLVHGGALPSGTTQTSTGFTVPGDALQSLSDPADLEMVFHPGNWVESECGVSSISGSATSTTVTMDEPCFQTGVAWVWASDGLPAWLQNAPEYLSASTPGQFAFDSSSHKVYYVPQPGQNLATADVEAGDLENLLVLDGTAADPVKDVSFSGITFQDTTWLQPSGPNGMIDVQADLMQGSLADAQNWNSDTFVTPTSGATWHGIPYGSDAAKMPGAVEMHAGHDVTFSGDTFTHLGAAGLDMDGGTQNSHVTGDSFTDIAGNGVQLGTVATPNQSNSALIDSGDTIDDNYISGAAVEYQGGVGIWAGYVKDVDITHNELGDAAYSGISIGWGWGSEDTLPTIDGGNRITDNYVHDTLLDRQDGAGIYSLGPQPGGVISGNYVVDDTGYGGPIYLDQGSTDYTISGNVEQNVINDYLYLNSNNFDPTDTVHANGNYTTATSCSCSNAVVSGETISTNAQWPPAAQAIIINAGLTPAYRYLAATAVPSPYSTYSSASDTFAQDNGEFLISGAGANAQGADGNSRDQYGSIYQPRSFASGSTMTVRVDSESNTGASAEAGLAVRDSMTGAGSSNGYAALALTPGDGVVFQWEDSTGHGHLDKSVTADPGAGAPEWLRLARSGDTLSGYYSSNGATWTQIGKPVTLYRPSADLDAGMLWTSHNAGTAGVAAFSEFSLAGPSYAAYASTPADIDQQPSGAVSLQVAGTDVSTGIDQYAALYQPSGADSTSTTTVKVTGESDTNGWQKAGIMLRDSIPGQSTSLGYATIAVTPDNGVILQWDGSSSGYLNDYTTAATGTTAPIWLRLVRDGTSVTGEYSTDDRTWNTVATETLTGSNATEDVGMFTTSHLTSTVGQATFSGFNISG